MKRYACGFVQEAALEHGGHIVGVDVRQEGGIRRSDDGRRDKARAGLKSLTDLAAISFFDWKTAYSLTKAIPRPCRGIALSIKPLSPPKGGGKTPLKPNHIGFCTVILAYCIKRQTVDKPCFSIKQRKLTVKKFRYCYDIGVFFPPPSGEERFF